ncbi:MAG: peptidylprolyl isomerase, partial [Candidatus Aminicenantes bacterium]|nr:peptidylprolyl isomerase [Candidatus Aminicenantes bacterium]
MRYCTIIVILFFLIPGTVSNANADTIEGIYAIVNDEIITFSELENFRKGMTIELQNRFSGAELRDEIDKMKSGLLDLVIGRKVLISKAKEKNYDMNQYLELVIKEIMVRNKLETKDDLLMALKSQGISYEDFKKQRLDQLMQEKFIQESLGSRIVIDTSEIISFYKENIKKYTIPSKFKLNCIFLNKDHYFTEESIKSKSETITDKLKVSNDFIKTAKEYSELEGESNNYELGTFSKGELDFDLEKAATILAVSKFSDWIKTETGWYIIQLIDRTEPKLKEYKKVKKQIENILYE